MNTDPAHIAICAEYSTHTTDQPPVGPCVLRPRHLGRIHQDVRGTQWAAADYGPEADQLPDPSAAELQVRLHAAIRVISRSEEEIADLRAELWYRDEAMAKQRSACQRALRDVAAVQRVRDLANRWYGQGAPATSYARELLATLDNAA
ncbi:hypothetical protein ABT282_15880 [Streptomyces sp. NPDC000927]|uniref:hypothetical protein n=1 Tax=Streptomyces sp. NPDC000927 TaxID=3154371 RepID=UPI0033229A66